VDVLLMCLVRGRKNVLKEKKGGYGSSLGAISKFFVNIL
jgi:hypothetical protein